MCEHETVIFSKCKDCGCKMIKSDNTENNKNTMFNIKNYNIPDNIRQRAMNLYNNMQVETKKGTKRKELEFFLIYSAFKEEGIVVEPKNLAKKMGMNPNLIGKAHSTFSYSVTGYKPPIVIKSSIDLIPELAAMLGAIEMDMITAIIESSKELLEKNPELCEHSPQKLAVAFICVYLEKYNYQLDKHILCDLVSVTDGTLNSVMKSIKAQTV